MGRRENTFRIDFSNVPKKPDLAKVHSFCATVLGLKQGEVLRIQNSRALGVSFVKVVDLALAQRVCEEHDNKHEVTVDGKKFPLRITLEDGAVEVRLHDLSEVSDEKIIDYLARYGDVISVREQRCGADIDFPGIPTGVRIVRMTVKRNIESWITIDGEVTNVSYYGQLQTCRHCRECIHIGATCVQNKKLLVQKSYADTTKQTPSKTTNQAGSSPNPTTPNPIASTSRANQPKSKNSSSQAIMPPPAHVPSRQQLIPPPAVTEQNYPSLSTNPGSVQPSDGGPLTPSTGQQPPASGGASRKTAGGKSDGNETDASVNSDSSKKSRTSYSRRCKKARVEDGQSPTDDETMGDGGNQPI